MSGPSCPLIPASPRHFAFRPLCGWVVLEKLDVFGTRLPVGVARPFLCAARHLVAVTHPEEQGSPRAIDVFVQLAAGVDDKASGVERNRLGWGTHHAAALEAEVNLRRIGMTVIGTGLARFPAGDRHIAFAGRTEDPFHMFFCVEPLLGRQTESVHLVTSCDRRT